MVDVDGVIADGALAPFTTAPAPPRSCRSRCPALEPGTAAPDAAFATDPEQPWAPAGHVVGRAQLEVASTPGLAAAPGPSVADRSS